MSSFRLIMSKPYNPQDRFFQKAKDEGFRARSVYKLEAIQNKFHLIRSGNNVLDLGAAPGSFMQFIIKVIGPTGKVIGVDLKPIKDFKVSNAKSYEADIFDEKIYQKILAENNLSAFDVVTSDLAPSTTGIRSLDAGRSFQLNEQVLRVASVYLRRGGNVLLKAFPGEDHSELIRLAKQNFKQSSIFRPEAVRKSSREVYIICLGKK
jgi:23S rRNA (uridine2552-2'-O)-methyltransferase